MKHNKLSKTALCLSVASVLSAGSTAGQAASSIEELIVTAQRRAETAQEIPIAIAAFSSEQLSSLSTSNLQELTGHISSAELFDDRGAGQPTWVIRGVGLADFNANNTPTAAIYYDDHYLSSNILGGIGMFDIDRVEVLKGPQGGLYGRNTSGGAVRINSVAPVPGADINGHVSASYGSWDKSRVEAAVGSAINDKSAFRIAAMTEQGGGWQDSLATPQDDNYGDRDFSAAKAQLFLLPSDDLEVIIKVEGGEDKSETLLALAKAIYNPSGPGYCASAVAGKADSNSCALLSNATNALVISPDGDPGLLPSLQKQDGTKVLTNPINALDNSWGGANVKVNWDFGVATLSSISAYVDYTNKQIYDYDAEPLALLHEDSKTELKSWSQEFRLVSNDDEDIYWLAGISYSKDEMDDERTGSLDQNFLVFATNSTRGYEQVAESWAAYGQVDKDITDSITINGSLRYTAEDKEFNNAYHFDNYGQFYYLEDLDYDYRLDANWSGHVGIDWAPTSDAMIYGKITRGFKSGGFYGGFAFEPEELDAYKEETVISYEVGFKSDWLDSTLRVNGAAFYYDYQDVQGFLEEYNAQTNTALTKLGNLGVATHKGLELDVTWLPFDIEGLTLQLGLTWLNAEFTDSDVVLTDLSDPETPVGTLEGLDRTFSPKFSSTVVINYERNVSEDLVGGIQLNYSYRDDIASRDSYLTDLNYAAYGQKGYELLNGRITLNPANNQWQLALVGKNLLDEVYVARATGSDLGSFSDLPGQPRSFAIEMTYNWE
ncbi:TonB-dependent receptor [Dasania marina]|uniref:TonB-dependent receptor n=1 Tax=Dasania marina TaxID=471499 RepID=UPI00037383AF|nr:TonB-dependent receptor [Dasania marina]